MPSLAKWFESCNDRQTIEAGNKVSKTVFKVQHLMSRSRAGIALKVSFTPLASNFVRFVAPGCASASSRLFVGARRCSPALKALTRIAANAPAYIELSVAGCSLQFTHQSSLPNTVIYQSASIDSQLTLQLDRPVRIASP